MNEHSFINAIHRKLPQNIYKWKINDNFHGGVADAYYSGAGGDLWIEYKYISKPPKKLTTKIKTCLTDQQLYWLKSRQNEGRNVALIIGMAPVAGDKIEKNLIITDLNETITSSITNSTFMSSAIDRQGVVSYIIKSCL